jgi:hypothetical protein
MSTDSDTVEWSTSDPEKVSKGLSSESRRTDADE